MRLKQNGQATAKNEETALQLVEKYAKDIPAPKFILMTRIPGDRLDLVLFRMTYEERKALGRELDDCVKKLRGIPNNASRHLITNSYGGPAYDYRLNDRECGPLDSAAELATYLSRKPAEEQARAVYPDLAPLYTKKHKVYFTHSDLHHSNIYVHTGKLIGIVDREYAGFKPEYWGYTRSLWAYFARKEQKLIMDEAFRGEDYREELEAEMRLWEHRLVS